MKLLFITSYFHPEVAASSYLGDNIRSALCDAGIPITLFAPVPSRGLSKDERRLYKGEKKQEILNRGLLTVNRYGLFREGKNALLRALRYTVSSCKQFCVGISNRDARQCDVLFVTSTPPIQGAVAALIKLFRRNKIRFVYNLQDIFPDSLVGTGLANKGGILWKIGRAIEDFTYRHADKIIVISEDFKRNIMAKGVPESKIAVIYNWVDENAVVDIPRTGNKLFDKYGLDRSKFYITYSGNIGLTQNMEMLLDVMEELKSEAPDIRLVLIGDGAFKEQVRRTIAEKNLTNVCMLPFQPYEDISHVFSLGDVGLVISKPGVGANSVPSKTWSIMSASRPVLASFDENELKGIIGDHQCGVFTKAGDKQAFKQSVLDLYNNPSLCVKFGRNGRQFVMDHLTREVGARKYVTVIESIEP